MNPLDIVLVILALAYAVAGFRQGFLIGALGVVGLLGGGLLGTLLVPLILNRFDPSMTVSLAALGTVIVCAIIGQTVGAAVGEALRSRVTWRPAHALDATGGAVLSVVAVLVVAWILGSAVAGAQLGEFARVVKTSEILATIDRAMPARAQDALLAFSRVVDPGLFPRYIDPFTEERINPVNPPGSEVLRDRDVERAANSVVRVTGVAYSCSRSLEGTGFVYASGRVMTNAHVVAGVREPQVQDREGRTYDAEVVLYNPERDIAVLEAPDLGLPALEFDQRVESGDEGVVLGYPENGPFTAGAARVRAEQRLRGPDIYGDRNVVREVYSLYADVRPGNSGGPLVSPDGEVSGVIFAASVEDANTGYALTVDEVASDAEAGVRANRPVSTGACA